MKQGKWLILMAVGILMMLPGCDRLGDKQVNAANTANDKLVVPIVAEDTIPVGTINMWNDQDSVYIEYILDEAQNPADQWYLTICNSDIKLRTRDFPMKKGKSDPNTSLFAYQSGNLDHRTNYKFTVPAGSWTGNVYTATHADVCQLTDGVLPERNHKDGWAGPDRFPGKNSKASLFAYTFGDVGEGNWYWETAWSATEPGQMPFPGSDPATYINHTIGTTTSEELYIGQSTLCGTITVTDNIVRGKGQVFVTFHTNNGWYAKSFSLEFATVAGGIPQQDGNPLPDQFRYQSGALDPYVHDYTLTQRVGWPEVIRTVVVAARADVGLYY